MNGAKEPGEKEWRAVHFFHLTLLLSYILYFLKTCIHVQTVQNTSVFVAFGKKDVFNVIKPLKKKKMRKKAIEGTKTRRTFLLNILYFIIRDEQQALLKIQLARNIEIASQ